MFETWIGQFVHDHIPDGRIDLDTPVFTVMLINTYFTGLKPTHLSIRIVCIHVAAIISTTPHPPSQQYDFIFINSAISVPITSPQILTENTCLQVQVRSIWVMAD